MRYIIEKRQYSIFLAILANQVFNSIKTSVSETIIEKRSACRKLPIESTIQGSKPVVLERKDFELC